MYVSKREEEGREKTRERDENSAGAPMPAGGNV